MQDYKSSYEYDGIVLKKVLKICQTIIQHEIYAKNYNIKIIMINYNKWALTENLM